MTEIYQWLSTLGGMDVFGLVRIFSLFNFVILLVILVQHRMANSRIQKLLEAKLSVDATTFTHDLEKLVTLMNSLNEYQLVRGKQTEALTEATNAVVESTETMLHSIDLIGSDLSFVTQLLVNKADTLNKKLDDLK